MHYSAATEGKARNLHFVCLISFLFFLYFSFNKLAKTYKRARKSMFPYIDIDFTVCK